MSRYKSTLNLPRTDFPMKANLTQREPILQRLWDKIDLYGLLRQRGKHRKPFILHDGPPYANGSIHLGTALNKTLKDIVMKSKALSGYDVPFIPGWDCHGLPIALKVEKEKPHLAQFKTLQSFRVACHQFAASQVKHQSTDFKRLGVIADWKHPYLTSAPAYEAATIRALAKIMEKGYLYRGRKPVHWCLDCGSALAEAEVEYQSISSPAIDVAFEAIDVNAVLSIYGCHSKIKTLIFPIWTTTPWTLPANQAVCVNPKLFYVLVACELNQRSCLLILAKDLLTNVMHRYQVSSYQCLAETKGQNLEHLYLKHPFLDRTVPIILGDHVTTERGTGNVHTAPAHGQEDYIVGERYHLPVDNLLDVHNCFLESVPLVSGLNLFEANCRIIEEIQKQQRLLHQAEWDHSYPYCWRHKAPLIFQATPQWFISMERDDLRAVSLKAIRDCITWMPSSGKSRIENMVALRPDWCISRQRAWGIPIPVFIHKKTQLLHPDYLDLMYKVADLVAKEGISAWFDSEVKDWIASQAADYEKSIDVLDVWLESGLSHTCVLEQNPLLAVPADLYLEGSDQHRGWFQASLLTSMAMRAAPPYKAVLTHGYVVDSQGMKMSKSIGNTVSPNEIIKKYGADILRLWVASSDFVNDIRYSDEIMSRVADAYRRIRNTARFLLSNLYDFDPEKDIVHVKHLLSLDFWAIQTAAELQKRIIDAYDRYHFQSIYQMIHNFCTVEMGSFYLDIIKDRQYTCKADALPRRSAQTALYYILEAFVRWLAPILAFTGEEIWQHMLGDREASVFLSSWFTGFPLFEQRQESLNTVELIKIRNAVNKILEKHRKHQKIGSALDTKVVLYANDQIFQALSQFENELHFFLITSEAHVFKQSDRTAFAEATDLLGLWVDVTVLKHEKCERCWQRCSDIGSINAYPELCQRCVSNISGTGEVRRFV